MYKLSLIGLMCLGLLGYSQVFCNSLQSQLDAIFGKQLPRFYSGLIFGVIAVPLSCVDLTEQISVQVRGLIACGMLQRKAEAQSLARGMTAR